MTEQGQVYADFIAEEVQRELSRRDGINAQATALLAGTGGMLTVTVAVVALVRRPSAIGSLTVTLLAMAVVGYLFGAALALFATVSLRYRVGTGEALVRMVTDHWTDSSVAARNVTAGMNAKTVGSLRVGNNRKARLLVAAGIVNAVAIGLLAVGVLSALA